MGLAVSTADHLRLGVLGEGKKAAQDLKMTTYLNQGVKAKMFEITPFVNTIGTQYIASRAKTELACDSIRAQDKSQHLLRHC